MASKTTFKLVLKVWVSYLTFIALCFRVLCVAVTYTKIHQNKRRNLFEGCWGIEGNKQALDRGSGVRDLSLDGVLIFVPLYWSHHSLLLPSFFLYDRKHDVNRFITWSLSKSNTLHKDTSFWNNQLWPGVK